MDAMTTASAGKKRATRQPRKTHARIYKWKLWTGDTHLQYFTQFSRLANTFEESIWAYTVMHPSVMHEDTLRMSLQHNEEGESDPLLFNVNILVALAARLIGDCNTQKEFYHRARTQLADLFDCQSIEVAEGLGAMAYYALGEADFSQFSYYNTLSLRMCQQLRAYHTDAFSRSFYVFLLDPSNSFREKLALVKSLASLGPSGPRLPISALAAFYHSCPEISPPPTPLASTAAPPSSPSADDPYAQYLYTRVSHIQNEEQRRKMYSQLRKSTIMAIYTTNCTFLLAAYKSRQLQERQLPPAPTAPSAAAHQLTGPDSDDLYGQLLENLDFYEADLAGLDDCGMAARLTATLAWAALKTEAHWEAGQRDLAKQSAQRFVKEVESFRSDICSLSCTSSMRFANVCSILLQCGEAETLRYLLELVEPWARGFTLGTQITTKFKNLLPAPLPTQRGNRRKSSK